MNFESAYVIIWGPESGRYRPAPIDADPIVNASMWVYTARTKEGAEDLCRVLNGQLLTARTS